MASRGKLTKKDIDTLAVLSIFEQVPFSYERMQAGGYTCCMGYVLDKIYADDPEQKADALKRNMTFINTEPHMATFMLGLQASLEEAGEDRDLIMNIRNGLFGPFAGLGDAIFWFTLLPVTATICCSMAAEGNPLGPIIYIVLWFLLAILPRIWFCRLGYKLGTKAVDLIADNAPAIAKAAGILGVLVVGGLIPSYVAFAFNEGLVLTGGVPVQGIFDSVLPNILQLGIVLLFWFLMKKKNVSSVTLIGIILVASVVLTYFNILAY